MVMVMVMVMVVMVMIGMTFEQVQQQMKDLMNFPLAVYLNTVMSNPFFWPLTISPFILNTAMDNNFSKFTLLTIFLERKEGESLKVKKVCVQPTK